MALRDKLTERVQGVLKPGDTVRHVFMTQSGMSPYSPLGGAIGALIRKYWVVGVTDTEFVVCVASKMVPSKLKSVAYSLPRVVIEPEGKLWAKTDVLGPETMYINRRFFKDLNEQNAELGQTPPAS